VVDEAHWDMIAAKMVISESRSKAEKPLWIAEKMGFNKPVKGSTPLSDIYAEPKPVNQAEAVEFKAWYDLVKVAGLVDYSYNDARCHAIVILFGGDALP
jgi:hypothetical protein